MIKPDLIQTIEKEGFTPRKKGKFFWLSCPFHEEKTPSLKIDPDKQRFHCFGCGESGDSIAFIQKLHGQTFRETLRYLKIQDHLKIDSQQHKKRTLVKAFREWESSFKKELTDFYRNFHAITRDLQTWDDVESFAEDFHLIPIVEWYLEILANGTDQEKYILYKKVN